MNQQETNHTEIKVITAHTPFKQSYFHGTRADLKVGDLVNTGFTSNYDDRITKYVYLTATLDAAVWGAELAVGEGGPRIYLVEPIGDLEDDPNVTNKKFPGNPTLSYRSKHPFKVIAEICHWQGHSSEQVQMMKDNIERLKQQGLGALED